MQPSSLVFVVIVGIWAAFFVQYWVRRREHIATARSVDAFTETMRVLEVRSPSPSVEMGDRPRSYAVSPARPSRPAVVVKRAGVGAEPNHDPALEGDSGAEGPWRRGGIAGILDRVSAAFSALRHAPRAPRGLTLLVGLLGTIVFSVLSLVGVLLTWAPLVPMAMAIVGFAWLRADVRAAQRAGRAAVDPLVSSSRSAVRPGADLRPGSPSGVRPGGVRTDRHSMGIGPAGPGADQVLPFPEISDAASAASDPRDSVFDVSAGAVRETVATPTPTRRASASNGPLLDEDDMPLTWDPVPVPRPTYTMKAKATRVPVSSASAQSSPARSAERVAEDASVGRPSARAAADLTAGDWDDDVPDFFPTARRATG